MKRFLHRHRTLAWPAVALAAAIAACSPPQAQDADAVDAAEAPSSAFVIRDARVFEGKHVLDEADVLVRDGLIAAVGADLDVADGVREVDASGRTLLPGLIDAHVHAWGEARRDALRLGVTTELDMFSDFRQLEAARRERASLEPTDQADLWSAGTLATADGGHGTQFGIAVPTLASPEEATAWVRARVEEGSDYIKIVREDLSAYSRSRSLPALDDATAAAVIDAAHAADRMAVVHASTLDNARHAIGAGADGLVHVFQDRPADDAFVALAKEKGAFVVPTLAVIAGFSGERSDVADDPALSPWLTAGQRESLQRTFGSGGMTTLLANARESVRALHAAGVPILAGTDAPNPNTAHGVAMHEELVQLTRAGLSPAEALAAATSVPADAFGLDDRGRIAPGKRADLLLVDGDPTQDVRATRGIVTIWKNGHEVERTQPVAAAPASGVKVEGDLVSDFEQETVEARYGVGWAATSDERMGGQSQATIALAADGANGSAGALSVSGEVREGFIAPWAGAIFFPGAQPMQPVDWSDKSELAFRVRGDGREYSAMLFSANMGFGPPPSQRFVAGEEWTDVVLPLSGFVGADPATASGIAFTAGLPAGTFAFAIDDVEVR